jgi:hypothetical protein
MGRPSKRTIRSREARAIGAKRRRLAAAEKIESQPGAEDDLDAREVLVEGPEEEEAGAEEEEEKENEESHCKSHSIPLNPERFLTTSKVLRRRSLKLWSLEFVEPSLVFQILVTDSVCYPGIGKAPLLETRLTEPGSDGQ